MYTELEEYMKGNVNFAAFCVHPQLLDLVNPNKMKVT